MALALPFGAQKQPTISAEKTKKTGAGEKILAHRGKSSGCTVEKAHPTVEKAQAAP